MEISKPVNPNSKIEFWTGFASKYSTGIEEQCTFQSAASCFAMVNTHKPGQKICEVGCGSGVGALSFASVFLQERGILISSDYCVPMV